MRRQCVGKNVGLDDPEEKNSLKFNKILTIHGARGRNRTADTAIFSRMLYQLSYPGPRWASATSGGRRYRKRTAACPAASSIAARL